MTEHSSPDSETTTLREFKKDIARHFEEVVKAIDGTFSSRCGAFKLERDTWGVHLSISAADLLVEALRTSVNPTNAQAAAEAPGYKSGLTYGDGYKRGLEDACPQATTIGTLPDWGDPNVQTVYKLMVDDSLNEPPHSQHWEGWVARHIVQALRTPPQGLPSTCYIERSKVREILVCHDGINSDTTGDILKEVDALQIFTANDFAQPQAAWQLIETYKPDDLHNSVLVVDRGHVSEAYFNGEDESWWLANTSEHDFDHSHAIYPSHWLPLPAAPLSRPLRQMTDGDGK